MLMSTKLANRILAVEIRAARLGYAVLESPKYLRDFGAATFQSPRAIRSRITRLLRLYQPSVLVLQGAGRRYPRDMRIRKTIARVVRNEAIKAGVSSIRISEQAFKSFFKLYACRDKYEVAALIATWFPELAWRVPPSTLSFYDPEPRQMLYFDSIALAVAYFELSAKSEQSMIDDELLSPASK